MFIQARQTILHSFCFPLIIPARKGSANTEVRASLKISYKMPIVVTLVNPFEDFSIFIIWMIPFTVLVVSGA